jgi:signal transduction histidine kinase
VRGGPGVVGRRAELFLRRSGETGFLPKAGVRGVRWLYLRGVQQVWSRWRRPWVQRAGDALLALVLAVSSVMPVLTGDPSWGTPKTLGLTLALVSTVPVAWRSRFPLCTAAVVIAADGACTIAAIPYETAFQPFLALTLASYSVGSRSEGPRAVWVPPVLAVAAFPLFVTAVAYGQRPGNAYTSYVWVLAAWAVGRTVRSWRHKSDALEIANVELARQRERAEQAAVAVERGRIARELHDVIAHNVAMMVLQAGAAERVLDGEQPLVRNALDVIASTGRQTVDEMRAVLGVLRDGAGSTLRPQPGLVDLAKLAATMLDAGLPVAVTVEGAVQPLPQVVDLSAFRIVQEALTNALKHAGPTHATVTVTYRTDGVEIEVRDFGPGDGAGHGTGNGLIGMRERVAMLGGELVAARTDDGFRVHARLPTASPA